MDICTSIRIFVLKTREETRLLGEKGISLTGQYRSRAAECLTFGSEKVRCHRTWGLPLAEAPEDGDDFGG